MKAARCGSLHHAPWLCFFATFQPRTALLANDPSYKNVRCNISHVFSVGVIPQKPLPVKSLPSHCIWVSAVFQPGTAFLANDPSWTNFKQTAAHFSLVGGFLQKPLPIKMRSIRCWCKHLVCDGLPLFSPGTSFLASDPSCKIVKRKILHF